MSTYAERAVDEAIGVIDRVAARGRNAGGAKADAEAKKHVTTKELYFMVLVCCR